MIARSFAIALLPGLLTLAPACVKSNLDNAFDPQFPLGLAIGLAFSSGGAGGATVASAASVCQSSSVTIGSGTLTGSAWTQFGANLDNFGAMVANHAAIGFDGSMNPYVVFREETSLNVGRVYLKFWNGAAWTTLGPQPINPADLDQSVFIAMDGSTPYIAYAEPDGDPDLHIHSYNGSTWSLVGGAVANLDASKKVGTSPSLAVNGSNLYVAWSEEDGTGAAQLRVKYWNGAGWTQVGGILNVDTSYSATRPSLKFFDDIPYVSFIQSGATSSNLYVKGYNTTTGSWEQLGNAGVISGGTTNALSYNTLDFNSDGVPFINYQISDPNASPYVSYLQNCTDWNLLGTEVSIMAANVNEQTSMAMVGDTPYVAFHDFSSGNVVVRYWDGLDWTTLGSAFSFNYPRMIYDGAQLWVASAGTSNQTILVHRYQ